MREFINIILRESLSYDQAHDIFLQYGAVDLDLHPGDLNSMRELKSAHRVLVKKFHPDIAGGNGNEMKLINSAFDTLKDYIENGETAAPKYTRSKGEQTAAYGKKDFRHIDYVKYYFAERAKGKTGVKEWTVWNFDGTFFRGVFTVLGTEDDFSEMARIMKIWDRFFDSVAIFVSRGHDLWLISLDDQPLTSPIYMEHDSHNNNPANDQQFQNKLPQILDKIRHDAYGQQPSLDI